MFLGHLAYTLSNKPHVLVRIKHLTFVLHYETSLVSSVWGAIILLNLLSKFQQCCVHYELESKNCVAGSLDLCMRNEAKHKVAERGCLVHQKCRPGASYTWVVSEIVGLIIVQEWALPTPSRLKWTPDNLCFPEASLRKKNKSFGKVVRGRWQIRHIGSDDAWAAGHICISLHGAICPGHTYQSFTPASFRLLKSAMAKTLPAVPLALALKCTYQNYCNQESFPYQTCKSADWINGDHSIILYIQKRSLTSGKIKLHRIGHSLWEFPMWGGMERKIWQLSNLVCIG